MGKVDSLLTYWEGFKDEILDGCDLCGACLEACPRYQYPNSGLKNPQLDVTRYHEFWRTGKAEDGLYTLIHTCTGCAFCRDVCPKGYNVYDAYHHFSKYLAWKAGLPPRTALEPRIPHVRGNIAAVLSAMQMRPEQVRWHWDLDSDTPMKRVLLFIGCITHSHPDKILTLLDVFDRMGVDYLPLGGGPICCGGTFIPNGLIEDATRRAKHMVSKFNAYGADDVVFWCANCVRHCTGFISQITDPAFEAVHASTFIARNLDRLHFTQPQDLRVNVHDSCVIGRSGLRDYRSVRAIFEAIPGLKLVEHAEPRERTPCCAAGKGEMNRAMRRHLYGLVASTGADVMATVCNTCTMTMGVEDRGLPFEVTNFMTVVGRALGIGHEERLKSLAQLGNLNQVIEASRACFQAHGYSEEEVRAKVGPILT
jgi:Fe-S oxidoreductase